MVDSDATELYVEEGFNLSDDKPLSSLQRKSRSLENATNKPTSETVEIVVGKVGRGQLKGSTSNKRNLYSDTNVLERVHLSQCSVRSDGVDEECAEAGIVYRRWVPDPEMQSHVSIRPFLDNSVLPEEQKLPGHCLLSPKKSYFTTRKDAENHYNRVHIEHCIVVEDSKILMCKCSDMCSRGTDYCTHNRHYHCFMCFRPCDQKVQLAKHLIIKHQVHENSVMHLIPKEK